MRWNSGWPSSEPLIWGCEPKFPASEPSLDASAIDETCAMARVSLERFGISAPNSPSATDQSKFPISLVLQLLAITTRLVYSKGSAVVGIKEKSSLFCLTQSVWLVLQCYCKAWDDIIVRRSPFAILDVPCDSSGAFVVVLNFFFPLLLCCCCCRRRLCFFLLHWKTRAATSTDLSPRPNQPTTAEKTRAASRALS